MSSCSNTRTVLIYSSYDASVITFIATKTDDLSCTEVVGALGLDDNPELVEIEAELDAALLEVDQWTATSKSVVEEMRGETCFSSFFGLVVNALLVTQR